MKIQEVKPQAQTELSALPFWLPMNVHAADSGENMKEKRVIITGGTSGIGLAAASMFLEQGARVVLAGRSSGRGEEALQSLPPGVRSRAAYVPCDVAKPEDCRSLVEDGTAWLGGVDVLVNSAGIYLEQPIESMTEELFDRVMDVNVKGTYFMCRYAVPELRKEKDAAIVNVSSDAGLHGNYGCTAYCASKGAVALFTRSLALEVASFGLRVNCVCPGDILTPMTERQLAEGNSREETLREMQSVYPMGRIGRVEEAASVIVFLASPAASFVTGAAWSVDGGLTA